MEFNVLVKFEIRFFFSCFPTFTLLQKSSSQALRSEHFEAVGIWLAECESLFVTVIWLADNFLVEESNPYLWFSVQLLSLLCQSTCSGNKSVNLFFVKFCNFYCKRLVKYFHTISNSVHKSGKKYVTSIAEFLCINILRRPKEV